MVHRSEPDAVPRFAYARSRSLCTCSLSFSRHGAHPIAPECGRLGAQRTKCRTSNANLTHSILFARLLRENVTPAPCIAEKRHDRAISRHMLRKTSFVRHRFLCNENTDGSQRGGRAKTVQEGGARSSGARSGDTERRWAAALWGDDGETNPTKNARSQELANRFSLCAECGSSNLRNGAEMQDCVAKWGKVS